MKPENVVSRQQAGNHDAHTKRYCATCAQRREPDDGGTHDQCPACKPKPNRKDRPRR